MGRVTNAPASRERRRRRLDDAKGFRGSRSKLFRQATEAVNRAQRLNTIHRKQRKRDFRRLWIARINAAGGQLGCHGAQHRRRHRHRECGHRGHDDREPPGRDECRLAVRGGDRVAAAGFAVPDLTADRGRQ